MNNLGRNLYFCFHAFYRFEILEFLKALCVCWPFDMAVEFLNESEKNGKIIIVIIVLDIRGLLEKLSAGDAVVLKKLHQKFKV